MGIESVLNDEDTMFHYTKRSTAIEHILSEKRLQFSRSVKTNDPREYKNRDFTAHINWSGRDSKFDKEVFYERAGQASKQINKIIRLDYKLACFCSNEKKVYAVSNKHPQQLGYKKLRMWSQYGEEFYGVCIAFSVTSLERRLREQLGEKAIIDHDFVKYEKDLFYRDIPTLNLNAEDFIDSDKDIDEYANGYVRDNVKRFFFTKHEEYEGENEYRFVIHDPNNNFEYLNNIDICFKMVLLGDRFNVVYQNLIKGLCDDLDIKCKQVEWDQGRLKLLDIN
jgi:hypothetical protein